MNNFWQRTLTGIGFVIVMLAAIYFSKYSFMALFFVINLLALQEFYHNSNKGKLEIVHWGGIIASSIFYLLIVISSIVVEFSPLVFLLLFPALFVLMSFSLWQRDKQAFKSLGDVFIGLIYISVPIFLLVIYGLFYGNSTNTGYSYDSYNGVLIIVPLVLIWVNDVFAYLGGILYGKNKLAPRLSPKKTIEGFLTGIVFTIIGSFFLLHFVDDFTLFEVIIIGVVVSLSAVMGDLVESKWKRGLGIKDSGHILPGHGGMLDRFDAFLFVVPFYLFCLLLIS
jgi:phosphatidate cytidylyltransferase